MGDRCLLSSLLSALVLPLSWKFSIVLSVSNYAKEHKFLLFCKDPSALICVE